MERKRLIISVNKYGVDLKFDLGEKGFMFKGIVFEVTAIIQFMSLVLRLRKQSRACNAEIAGNMWASPEESCYSRLY